MFAFERGIIEATFGFVSQAVFLKPLLVFFGGGLPYIIVFVFLVKLFSIKSLKLRYSHLFAAALGVLISRGIITEAFGYFLRISRPFVTLGFDPVAAHMDTPSFPSGHMAFLIPIALVGLRVDRKAGLWLVGLTLLVGVSRFAMGLHWPSDIVGGVLVGMIGLFIADRLIPKKI